MASRFVRVWGIAALLLAGGASARASYAPGCTVALDVVGAITHEIHAVAIQPDGKIVVAGYADLGSGKDVLVARLHPDLTLDKSFNGTGYRVADFYGLDDEAFAVAIQFDQKIVVAGYAQWSASQKYTAFVRYNRDGSPDTSWSPSGASLIDFGGSQVEEILGLAIQPDGKILGAGFLTPSGIQRLTVVRLDRDGNLDPTFGGSGTAQPTIGGSTYSFATGIVLDPDGSIVVSGEAGFVSSDFLVMRFQPDGNLDLTFQTSGYSVTDVSGGGADSASSVRRQLDGSYVVGGTSNGNAVVARYLTSGFLDPAFGGTGIVTRDFGGTDTGAAVALDGSGNILVAGQGSLTPNFAFARFLPGGGLDLSIVDDVSGMDDRAFALAVLKSGKILLGGSGMGPLNRRSTLALYKPDGTQDCGFFYLHPMTATAADFAIGGSCTDNVDCVNDQAGNATTGTPAPNDTASYVTSSASPATDQYRLADGILAGNKVVTEIEIVAQLAWSGSGTTPTGELFYQRQGYDGSPVMGGAVTVPSTSFTEVRKTFSGLDWSPAELDALEIGLDHTSGNNLRMSQMYVKVTFGDEAVCPVDVFTAAASGNSVTGQVMLNWLNPSYGLYDRTIVRRDLTCPLTPSDGTPVTISVGAPGQPGGFVDNPPLGVPYFYAAFVVDAGGHESQGACVVAQGFDRNASKTEWVYDTTNMNLTTPGLRLDIPGGKTVTYSISNDGVVHAIRGGLATAGGGSWPVGFKPFRIGGLVQSRPAVASVSGKTALLAGSQDGHAYAVDALTGDLLWKSAKLGTTVQAAPAVVTSGLGGADLVFVGTRDMGKPNRFYALDPVDGSVVWFFDNGGGAAGIGMIESGAAVDYAARRVYFASTQGSSMNTTWCLNYMSNPPVKCTGWANYGVATGSGAGGDIEGSPILFQGSIFVSETSAGDLYAVNPLDGSDTLYAFLGDAGAKGFVFPQYGSTNLLASTATQTMSVRSGGFNWAFSCIPTPSTPTAVPGTDWVFTGSSVGKLYQQSASSGPNCGSPLYACVGDCSSTIVGAPTYDVLKSMLYVGTDEGKIYALRAPF